MKNESLNTDSFWNLIDNMVNSHKIIIDRPKGSLHPKWKWVYEVNYGYLAGTTSADGEGIDIWVGSSEKKIANALICIIDGLKNDSEIKILIGCTNEEIEKVYELHNKFESMKGILIKR